MEANGINWGRGRGPFRKYSKPQCVNDQGDTQLL
jgi:hypothetical protein